MICNNFKSRSAFTIIELVTTTAIASIVVLIIGILMVGATNNWQQVYNKTHKQIFEDASNISLTFGSIGRRANRTDYAIYSITNSVFTPVESATPSQDTVVSGDAVEFRYWDVSLTSGDTEDLMDVSKTATAYTLFYLEGDKLKVDYGAYPPGGIPSGGGSKNTTDVKTVTLAENVSVGSGCGAFSHTVLSGEGYGSVRINLVLTDPNDGQQISVLTSVLLRNIWPQ